MVQVINRAPTLGERFGTGLGSGIGEGLQQLAESKAKDLLARQQSRRYEQTGLPSNIANLLANSPEAERKFLLQNLESLMNLSQSQGQGQQTQQMMPEALQQGTPYQEQMQMGQQGMQSNEMPAQQRQTFQQPVERKAPLFESPADRRARQQLEQGERKLAFQEQLAVDKQNAPWLTKQNEQYRIDKQIESKAKQAKQLLNRIKDKLPAQYQRALIPDKFFTDPDFRHLTTLYDAITTLLGQSQKGQPTKFKLELIQSGKVNKSQPVATQLANLDDLLKDVFPTIEREKITEDLKKENKGNYPRNIGSEVIERQRQMEYAREKKALLKTLPKDVYEGAILDDPETGKAWRYSNGDIEEVE